MSLNEAALSHLQNYLHEKLDKSLELRSRE